MATRGERNPWDELDDIYSQQAAGMPMMGGGRGGMPTDFPAPAQRLPTQGTGTAAGPPNRQNRPTELELARQQGLLGIMGGFGIDPTSGDVIWQQASQNGGGTIAPPPQLTPPPTTSPPKVETYVPPVETIPPKLLEVDRSKPWLAQDYGVSWMGWNNDLMNQVASGQLSRIEAMKLRDQAMQDRQNAGMVRGAGG